MEARAIPKESSTPLKPSMTSVAVLDAFRRGMARHVGYFDEEDIKLTTHMVNFALPKVGNTGLTMFSYMPDKLQHPIVSSTGGTAYDEHMLSRKMLGRDHFKRALANGAQIIISLAGGMDPRLYRLSKENPEVTFYELDRGPTRKIKINGLNRYCFMNQYSQSVASIKRDVDVFNGNLYCIDCDFIKDDLKKKLEENQFDPEKKKFIIAEGLTSYLDQEVNEELLANLQKLLQEGDEVLITYVPSIKHTEKGEEALKAADEPYLFALLPEEVIHFTSQFGFEVTQKALHEDLLEIIGEKDAAKAHRDHPEIPKAHFYLLSRSEKSLEELCEKKIDEVPNATLDLSIVYKPERTNCLVS